MALDAVGTRCVKGDRVVRVGLAHGIHQHFAGREGFTFACQAVVIFKRHKAEILDLPHLIQRRNHCVLGISLHAGTFQQAADGAAAVVQRVFRRKTLFRQNLRNCLADVLLALGRGHLRFLIEKVQIDLPGIARIQGTFLAEVQAGSGGDHHQHHGKQDAHRRQSRARAVHTVGHGGNGNKVIRLVVIPLVLLQDTAQKHRAGNKNHVSGEDHHAHRCKEHHQRGHRIGNGYGDVVRRRQQRSAAQAKQPVGLRGLLAHVFAAQKVDGAGFAKQPKRAQEDEQEYHRKQDQRLGDGLGRNGERVGNGAVEHVHHQRFRRLGKQHAREQTDRQGREGGNQRLPEKHQADGRLAHAQDVVQAKFLLPAPHQKGIGVHQKQHCEDGNHAASKHHH